jgi:hypothetical protein
MGNVTGGAKRGVIFDGVLNLGLDIDLERVTNWWSGGSIHANALWIYGPGLSSKRREWFARRSRFRNSDGH